MTGMPIPQLASHLTWALVGSLLAVGAGLLLWGARFHRVAMAVIGVAGGIALGQFAAQRLDVNASVACLAGAAALGILAPIAANLIWSLMAMAMALGTAAWFVASQHLAPAGKSPAPETVSAWLVEAWSSFRQAFVVAWQQQSLMLAFVLVCAAVMPLLVMLLRPRLARILMTSLLGAGAVVFALLLAAATITPDVWGWGVSNGYVLAGAGAVLMVAGLAIQYRSDLAREHEEDHEAEPVSMRERRAPREPDGDGGRKNDKKRNHPRNDGA